MSEGFDKALQNDKKFLLDLGYKPEAAAYFKGMFRFLIEKV